MRRRLVFCLLAFAANSSPAPSQAAERRHELQAIMPSMEDVLRKAPDGEVCYGASLGQSVTMDIEDWSPAAVTLVPVPGVREPNGQPAVRPEPQHATEHVTVLTLSLRPSRLDPSKLATPKELLMRFHWLWNGVAVPLSKQPINR